MTESVVAAVNIPDFIPSKSSPIHRYPWHFTFNTLLPTASLKEPTKQKPWTKCGRRPSTETSTVVPYACYNLTHVLYLSSEFSTYSATAFVLDIHFVLLRRKSEELEENITKEGGEGVGELQ